MKTELLTLKEFAARIKTCPETARQRCNSSVFRQNKIARREGRGWLVDWGKYRKVVWGESQ